MDLIVKMIGAIVEGHIVDEILRGLQEQTDRSHKIIDVNNLTHETMWLLVR